MPQFPPLQNGDSNTRLLASNGTESITSNIVANAQSVVNTMTAILYNQGLSFQSVVPGPAASASPRNWLKIQFSVWMH